MTVAGEREPVFFFKIILSSIKKLRIPMKFAREFRNDLSSSATLVVPPGKSWTVNLLSEGGEFWLREGLNEFYEFYSLTFGYFLLFEYRGKSEFGVRIFDLTACEISYPSNDASRKFSPSNQGDRIPLLSEQMSDVDDNEDANCTPDRDDNDDDANYTPDRDDDDDGDDDDDDDDDDDEQDDDANCNDGDDDLDLNCSSLDADADDANCALDDDAYDDNDGDDDDDVMMLDRPSLVSNPVDVLDLSSGDEASEDQPGENNSIMRTGPFPTKVKNEFEMERSHGGVDGEVYSGGQNVKNRNLQSKRSSVAPTSSIIKPKNVSFRAVMKPCDFQEPMNLIIPPKIGRKFPEGVSGSVKLEVSDGRTWIVQGNFLRGRLTSLGEGWADFARDTKLMVGDICQFELVRYDNEFSMKVSMYRKKPLTR